MRVWDQEPTACYIQARGRADDFIFLPLVHRNSASKHTADFISAFKKRHLLPFFPANNTTIVMPAGPFPMMATCLFYFLHAFDKACPDMKRRYRSHCWKCVSVRPCCPAHNVSRIVFHGHTPANSPHSSSSRSACSGWLFKNKWIISGIAFEWGILYGVGTPCSSNIGAPHLQRESLYWGVLFSIAFVFTLKIPISSSKKATAAIHKNVTFRPAIMASACF